MRRFSLRALLFALVLAVQAAAGGLGAHGSVASTGASTERAAISGHCDKIDHGGQQAPGQAKHDCGQCPLCAFYVFGLAPLAAEWQALALESGASVVSPERESDPPALSAQAHQARAPPYHA